MSNQVSNHAYYMQRALSLAARGCFTTRPNPNVGCVIVKQGRIVGEGWHQLAGTPHAEIHALNEAGKKAKGADLYVNLEPCSHYGRTPPCVHALIQAKIARVIIPFTDPNTDVNGKGIACLKEAGIEVITGIEVEKSLEINRFFFKAMTTRKPYVIAKWAMTLDGQLALAEPSMRWITCESAREHAHHYRAQVGAILVGAETLRIDQPRLTARLQGALPSSFKQPKRIVLSSSGLIDPALLGKIEGDIWIATATPHTNLPVFPHVHYLHFPLSSDSSQIDLSHLLSWLMNEDCHSLIVEGGAKTHDAFFKQNLLDELHVYQTLSHSGFSNRPAIPFFNDQHRWQLKEIQQLDQTIFMRGVTNAKN